MSGVEFLREKWRMLDKLYADMYEGNGPQNPSMTTRMANVEECIKDYKWMKRLILATLLAVLGDIISNHIHLK